MSIQLGSNPDKKRIDYLEAKCAYLCGRLAEIITKYTAEGHIRIVSQPHAGHAGGAPTEIPRHTDAEIIVIAAFQAILGRAPSDSDLAFYVDNLSKFGRARLIRDIILSHESIGSNSINAFIAILLRFFWHT